MKTKHPSPRQSPLVPLGAGLVAAIAVFAIAPRAPAQTVWSNALSFDGVDDYVQSQQAVDLANKSFSVEAWAQRRSSGTMDMIVTQGDGGAGTSLMFGFHWWGFDFDFYGDGVSSGDVDAAWHHWAGTYDASTKLRCLYRDGMLLASNVALQNYQGAGPLYIGRAPFDDPACFDGGIDEVRVWSVARSQVEIQENMLRPLSGSEANLLAYWNFNEGAGTGASDSTTNGFNATLINGPTWTASTLPQAPASWGNALSFDGTDDYVVFTRPVSNDFTLECWFRTTQTFGSGSEHWWEGAGLVDGEVYGGMRDFGLSLGVGKVLFGTGASVDVTIRSPNAVADGRWHHVAATRQKSDGAMQLFVDGALVASGANASGVSLDAPGQMRLGSLASGVNFFRGQIDEVRTWNQVRSVNQIREGMCHPLTGHEPGLVAYFRLDEETGTVAFDATANHFDGALVNGPVWTLTQPTVAPMPDYTVGQGGVIPPLPFTVADPVTLPEHLVVTVRSGNPALAPNTPDALILGGSGALRTLQVVPTPTAIGTATITVTVTDGRESAVGSFNLTVVPGPRLSTLARLTIGQATSAGPIALTVQDPDTPADQLAVTAGSENTVLVPNTPAALILAGSGMDRTLTVVPDPNATGSARISVAVSDGLSTDTRTFTLTVKPRPVISSIPNQTILQSSSTFALPFTVSDPDTPIDQLVVVATSDNLPLVPNSLSALILSGNGSERTLRVVPDPTRAGIATITVAATDGLGVGTASFTVRVLGAPSLSAIPNQTLNQRETTGSLPFTVSDYDTPPDRLTLKVTSANPALVPNRAPHLVLGGYGANRTLTVFPDTNHSGSAVITVSASDGTNTGRTSFTLTVRPRFDSPLLSITSAEPVPPQTWRFRFRDAGTASTNYSLEYISDLSPANVWSDAPGAAITPESDGAFRVDTLPPPGTTGFFRVKGFRLLMASFDSSGATVDEGAGTVGPVVVFNGPFLGTLCYSVSGSAGTNDCGALSGVVLVNGSTAVIPVPLTDNVSLGQLKYLTLTLQGGPGFAPGLTTVSTLTIEENDAEWQGRLMLAQGALAGQTNQVIYETNGMTVTNLAFIPVTANSALDFVLRIQKSGGTCQGAIKGHPGGFFPTNETPMEVSFTENAFSAQALDVPLPALNTSPLLDSPLHLTLCLEAASGQPNQNVRSNQVQGVASLRIHLPDKPHLDTTNLGTFLLLKPAPPPPTNEVRLVNP